MYAPMASAIAGGANRNSIRVAMPASTPPTGPNARRLYSNGPPACGMAVVSSVKLKMNVPYISATNADDTRKPSVPADAHP